MEKKQPKKEIAYSRENKAEKEIGRQIMDAYNSGVVNPGKDK